MGRRRRSVQITGKDNEVGSSRGNVDCKVSIPKRKKNCQKDGPHNSDRLSELPDPLIVEILSSLTMKDAIRTGVLSKRWKNLWTLVDRIRFCRDFENLERFISFVDRALMQCVCSNLKEFSLDMYHDLEFEPENPAIEKWIQYVSGKNVKFVNLEVNVCRFPLLGQLSWCSLEKLFLSYVYINDKEISDMLLRCPVLNTLALNNLKEINHLNIASPKLRKLKVLGFNGDDDYCDPNLFLEINAPWLQELVISGNFFGFDCRLVDVSSLVFAKVTCAFIFDCNYAQRFAMATEILKKVHHVEELIVGTLFIQALSVLKLLGKPSPLFKCKKLTIESLLPDFELPGIACLLQRSPHLETLVIQLQAANDWEPMYFDETYNVNGEKYLSMQKGNFQHLKNVRVVDGRSLCVRDESSRSKSFESEVVAYLLKNACILEKIVFTSQINNYCKCSIKCALQLSPELISSCLEGNRAAKYEFRKKQSEFEFIREQQQS